MKLGMIGLGRMGANMVLRLLAGGHQLVVYDREPEAATPLVKVGAAPARSLAELVGALPAPRAVWMMVPAGDPTDQTFNTLLPLLARGDIVIDGGNSNYKDSIRRATVAKAVGVHFLDAGTSGGVWGREVGYCLMVGGERPAFEQVESVFETLAPPSGYLYTGPSGSGHFTKMVHNGIEYGVMQAYAEGFEILKSSGFGLDLGQIAGLWNHGSVIRSWLLELAQRALEEDPELAGLRGYVEDSGEGRWTVQQAIDTNVAAPVITLSLLERLRSRKTETFADKLLAALRHQFGGHAVKK
jgi:6-phosphogluconate dehydrogenase